MSYRLITPQDILNKALLEARKQLSSFISDPNFNDRIDLAFGLSDPQQSNNAREIIGQWLAGENILPGIEIISSSSINGALGAYSADNNTIYLSQEFLSQNQNNRDRVTSVILEELGHAFSQQLNPEDVPGDEGAIFSLLVRNENISSETLTRLQTEDDTVTVNLNDRNIQIEQAEAGINPAFDLIGLTDLRNDPNFADIDGTGFDVVVIDTGLDRTHPLLDDNYRFGFDYIDGDDNPNDLNDHGTHVSGTIGAEDENIGVAPDVGLIGLRAGDANGAFSVGAVINALEWVLNEVNNPDSEFNIASVNLSFGGNEFFTAPNQPNSLVDVERRRLIQDIEAAGVVVVAAAGNDYIGKTDSEGNLFDVGGNLLDPNQEPNVSAPAIYSTISVGAVWQNNIDPVNFYSNFQVPGADRIAIFSQRLNVDNFLFAPGAYITSTVPQKPNGELLNTSAGTSQASPHVAGAVALLQEIAAGFGVRLSSAQVRDYLINNADIIADGDDEEDGVINTNVSYPRINIHNSAIALREDLENANFTPAPPTDPNNAPNDIIDGAIDVTLGNDREPLIFPGVLGTDRNEPVASADVDLYRLILPDNGTLNIDIDTPFADFPDSYIRLFNENGEELFFTTNNELVASDDDLAPGETSATLNSTGEAVVLDDENITNVVDGFFDDDGNYQKGNYGHATDSYLSFLGGRGQIYYIGVSDFSNQQYNPLILDNRPAPLSTDGGSYELIATFLNEDVDGSIDSLITSPALPTDSLTGFIGNDGATAVGDKDVDFYRVNSLTPGILEIDIDSVSEASIIDPVDSVIVLFDEQGNQISLNDDTDTTDSRLRFQVEANTNYYAGITGFGNQDFNPLASGSGSGGDTGEYVLNSRLLPLDTVSSISNNTIDSDLVRNVALGETIAANIGEDDGYIVGGADIDLYRFVPTNNGTVNIRVSTSEEFSADTVLRFFDQDGNEIAFNDDESSLIRGSFLEVEVLANTEYYIGINGYSLEAGNYDPFTGEGAAPGSQGDYNLSVGDITGTNLDLIDDDSEFSVYRFFRNDVGVHFYTANPAERDIVGELDNFSFEGVSYQSVDPAASSSEVTPVYRFLNQDTGVHLYTTSETERDIVRELDNFSFEGEVFSAYSLETGTSIEGAIPIFRFFNTSTGAHFYTPSVAERDNVEDNLPDFQSEGIAYYAFPTDVVQS
ncbi:S8 family serine peptidase [Waterburya agarophytonicola K14]|uniref:S8 family serine peptidase n=1 Tax=Waterburya agarophytonicola KI4 TaxID=2874699 RepID=A0A964BQT7_9CYAN|nr:S8 family serine peptidase [Waterburya agarophytonicola]MCC0177186.1 S8 family serine peptidase [Waterburya agarophytonicola KI4]